MNTIQRFTCLRLLRDLHVRIILQIDLGIVLGIIYQINPKLTQQSQTHKAPCSLHCRQFLSHLAFHRYGVVLL